MIGTLLQFLKMEVLNLHPMIYWALGLVWVLLLAAAVASVRSHDIAVGWKLAWLLLIFALPIAGLALYTIWNLFAADWGFLKPLLQSKSQAVQAVSRTGGKR